MAGLQLNPGQQNISLFLHNFVGVAEFGVTISSFMLDYVIVVS